MRRRASTVHLELVQTHKLARALKCFGSSAGGYTDDRWKRALYHALAIALVASARELAEIRTTLGLP